jgi:hypothetical protein
MKDQNDTPGTPEQGRQRFAKRVSGDGWSAEVDGVAGEVRVLKVSRIGIEIETAGPLESGARYPIRLAHGGETTRTTFYVLRCPEHRNGRGRSTWRPTGIFVETLDRKDLPEIIPTRPAR